VEELDGVFPSFVRVVANSFENSIKSGPKQPVEAVLDQF
jgi:hypothetical protein